MMDKKAAWLLAALLAVSQSVNADIKIAYVNANKVLDESPQAAEVSRKLKQEFSAREGELRNGQDEIKQLEASMSRDGITMSEDRRSKLERDILVRKRDMQNKADAFRDDLNLRRNEEMNKLLAQLQEVIIGLGKEQKYDLIVYEGVAYASSTIDITDKVLEKLRAAAQPAPAEKK